MNIVIFGPPGAGKGTQSNFIVKKFHLHQLSTGELLRKEIQNKTELGLQIEAIMNLIVNITLILSFFIILEIIQFGYSHRATLFYGNANYLAYALLPGLIFSIYTRHDHTFDFTPSVCNHS